MIPIPKALLAGAFFIAAVLMAGDAQMTNTRSAILYTDPEKDPMLRAALRRQASKDWWRAAIETGLALGLAALGGTLLG